LDTSHQGCVFARPQAAAAARAELQILHCHGRRKCQDCRGALPAIARRHLSWRCARPDQGRGRSTAQAPSSLEKTSSNGLTRHPVKASAWHRTNGRD
jgi:hypothetical protein